MCGIAGMVHLDGSPVDRGRLDALTDALAHRGPNGRGAHIDGNGGLGHRRLSVLDLSDAGAQPMLSRDGTMALTFNGEIYNFEELKKELEAKGHSFQSRSDTEVLLRLYEEEGPACLPKLRGMFAFGVLDRRRNILFLVRDRVGKKPLKYFRNGNTFAFASEWKALRTLPDCPREVDRDMLHHFLTLMYMPSPHTGIKGVHKLPAGHSLTLDLKTGRETIERYWALRYDTNHDRSLEEWEERIMTTLEESVRLRMVADVPLGAFLSGGIDSATIVALMSRHSPHPVKTFSIGSADPHYNELPQAALIAQTFNTDHHPIELKADIVHLLPDLVHTYEEPYADPSAIPTYLISHATRKVVTVALNGDGGDENFAGYVRYPIFLFSQKWASMPRPIHSLASLGVRLLHSMRNDTFSYRAKRFQDSIHLPWEQRYLQYISFFTEEEKRALYQKTFASNAGRTDLWYANHTAHARARAGDWLHQAMSMDLATYLADDLLPKVDLGTMSCGLEARSPFLDHHLLELTAAMPAAYQLSGRTTKWILKKRLLTHLLPPEILGKKKTGFRLPLNRWFRSDLKDWVRQRLMDSPPLFWEMFDREAVDDFLRQYHDSAIDYSDHIWSLLWLSEWLDGYTSNYHE